MMYQVLLSELRKKWQNYFQDYKQKRYETSYPILWNNVEPTINKQDCTTMSY